MAIPGEIIIDRVRAVATTGAGAVRTITAYDFGERAFEGQDGMREAMSALFDGKSAHVAIRQSGRHKASPPVTGSAELIEIGVMIRLAYPVRMAERMNADQRAALEGLVATDLDDVQAALEWPGNLPFATTRLVSGKLRRVAGGATSTAILQSGSQDGQINGTIRMTGVVHVVRATS